MYVIHFSDLCGQWVKCGCFAHSHHKCSLHETLWCHINQDLVQLHTSSSPPWSVPKIWSKCFLDESSLKLSKATHKHTSNQWRLDSYYILYICLFLHMVQNWYVLVCGLVRVFVGHCPESIYSKSPALNKVEERLWCMTVPVIRKDDSASAH